MSLSIVFTRLGPVATGLFVLLACSKGGPPPAAAADPIPLTGSVERLDALDVKYMHYAIGAHIDAPPEVVWEVLTDAPGFTDWNSTLVSLEGDIAHGNVIELTAKIDPKRTFELTVSTFEPSSRMVWEDGNNMFKGERTFTLAEADGGTDWTMKEAFSGAMLRMIAKKLPDFGPDFDAFAADLKTEAEARHLAAQPEPEPEPTVEETAADEGTEETEAIAPG